VNHDETDISNVNTALHNKLETFFCNCSNMAQMSIHRLKLARIKL
jgi:hypothetical protein